MSKNWHWLKFRKLESPKKGGTSAIHSIPLTDGVHYSNVHITNIRNIIKLRN